MNNSFGGFQGGQHGDAYANNYSKEDNQRFTEQFGAITEAMADAQQRGLATNDPEVQELIRRHYEFCLQFWKPTREAYKSLAMSYVLPSPYRDTYEAVSVGLGKYHYDAIVEWANRNLE